MPSALKQLAIHICHQIIDWVVLPMTHVALPALLMILHIAAFSAWESFLYIPNTLWSVGFFGLVVWLSGGLVYFLDQHDYFKAGAIAEFFGFDDESQN